MSEIIKSTCGIFLINSKGELLIVHPTHSPWNTWSIPKGLTDANESYLDAAIREAKEEIGIDLNVFGFKSIDYIELPHLRYNAKSLCSFILYVGDKLNNIDFKCNSFVNSNINFPEIDMINWVNLVVASNLLAPTQSGLIPTIIKELINRK